MLFASAIERRFDAVRVRDAHRDDAETLRRTRTRVLEHQLDDPRHFTRRTLLLRAFTRHVRNQLMANRRASGGAGERHEPAAVDAVIGIRDERLVAAAVMPIERPWRIQKGRHLIEDALETRRLVLV